MAKCAKSKSTFPQAWEMVLSTKSTPFDAKLMWLLVKKTAYFSYHIVSGSSISDDNTSVRICHFVILCLSFYHFCVNAGKKRAMSAELPNDQWLLAIFSHLSLYA